MINKLYMTNNIREYNFAVVDETLASGGTLQLTRRELGIGKHEMCAFREEQGNIVHSMDEIIKAEQFQTRLYASDVR